MIPLKYRKSILRALFVILLFSSSTLLAQPILPVPIPVTPANAASVSVSGLQLTWNSSAGADLYYGEVSTDSTFTAGVIGFSAGTSAYTIAGLQTGQKYFWRLRAWNTVSLDSSDWSSPIFFTTQLSAPITVVGDNHIAIQELQFPLQWSYVPNATHYRLEAGTDSTFATTVLNTTLFGIYDTMVNFMGLTNATKNFWRVKAFSAVDSSDYSMVMDFYTPLETTTLLAPVNNAVGVTTSALLTWANVTGANDYQVQVSTNNTFSAIFFDSNIANDSVLVSGLANGTTYYWRVKGRNSNHYSEFTSEFSFTTALLSPVLSSPANGQFGVATNPSLLWFSVTGAANYRYLVASDAGFTTVVATGLTADTTVSLSGLNQYTQYYWKVKAISASDSSDYASGFSFVTKIATPVLAGPADDAYQIALNPSLSWGAVSGASSYHVQVATDSAFSSIFAEIYPATNATTVSGLANNTGYFWRVKSKNANDSSNFSAEYNFTTLLATSSLGLPAAYSYGNELTTTVNWSAVAGATAYRVQFSTDSTFAVVASDDTISILNNAYSGLVFNTHYFWRVQALNTLNAGLFSSGKRFTTKLDVAVLNTPEHGVVDQNISRVFTWFPVSGANRYQLQIATDSTFSNIVYNASNLTDTSRNVSGLSYWQWYYWRVKSSNTQGNFGDFSNHFSFQTKLAPTTLVAPGASATNVSINPLFTWLTDTAATQYHLQFSTVNNFSSTILDSVLTDTSLYCLPILANNTVYYWRVRSLNAVSTSDYSTRSFTTVPEIIPYPSHPLGGQLVYTLTPTLYWYINVPAPGIQYDVLYSTDPTVPLATSTIADAADTIHYTIPTALIPGTKYYWRVRSKYAGPIIVKYSAIDSFTTFGAPIAPTPGYPLTGNTVHTLNPVLRWYMNLNVPFYTFDYRYKLSSSGTWADTVSVGSDLIDTLSGLTAGASYDWEVRTNNGDTTSSWSATQTFIVDGSTSVAPAVPVLAYPVGQAVVYTAAPTLYWYVTGNSLGLSYDIELRTDTSFTGTPSSSGIAAWYSVQSGLLPGQTYYWKARSTDGLTYSNWSAMDTFSVNTSSVVSTPVLTYPIDSASVYTSSPTLYFYTDTYNPSTVYHVEIRMDDSVSGSLSSYSSLPVSFVQHAGLLAGKTYYWRARSQNASTFSSWSAFEQFSAVGSAGSLVPIPTWPVGGVTVMDSISAALSWYVNGFSIQNIIYEIEINTSNSFSGTPSFSGIVSPLILNSLVPGTQYYYRLRSYNGNAYSAWSGTESFTTASSIVIPSMPQLGNPINNITLPTNAPVLSWYLPTISMSSVKYTVEYAETPTFANAVVTANVSAQQLKVSGLQNNKTYYWRVRSVNETTGQSTYSSVSSFIAGSTTVNEKENLIPKKFFVDQNYPNPFNPSTVIRFGLPNDETVSLTVFNILGQKVASIIVNEALKAGIHTYQFNATSLSSGMYMYRIEAGKHVTVKKMLFIK